MIFLKVGTFVPKVQIPSLGEYPHLTIQGSTDPLLVCVARRETGQTPVAGWEAALLAFRQSCFVQKRCRPRLQREGRNNSLQKRHLHREEEGDTRPPYRPAIYPRSASYLSPCAEGRSGVQSPLPRSSVGLWAPSRARTTRQTVGFRLSFVQPHEYGSRGLGSSSIRNRANIPPFPTLNAW
jgi:hypothetical protein